MDKEKIIEKVLLGIIITLLITIIIIIIYKKNHKEEIKTYDNLIAVEQVEEEKEYIPKYYNVDIKGSVKTPGVYTVKEGTIINEVIELAGGLKKGATTKNINLSKKITDEMVIYIYTETELKKKDPIIIEECTVKTEYIDTCDKTSIITTEDNKTNTEVSNSMININTASKEELMTLSGIGESKAIAIIEYRNNNPFKNIEDIKNVSGIGEAAYQKIKDSITI